MRAGGVRAGGAARRRVAWGSLSVVRVPGARAGVAGERGGDNALYMTLRHHLDKPDASVFNCSGADFELGKAHFTKVSVT
ncbi:hypothetical protein GCM10009551_068790 [Nocardiopsis tropica]